MARQFTRRSTYPFVASDTGNVRGQLAAAGAIVWHDYGMSDDVRRVVDKMRRTAHELTVHAIEGTRLAVALRRGGACDDAGARAC